MKAEVQNARPHADEQDPDGRASPQLSLHEAKDKTIAVDLNHLLAGKRLNFDVKVTDITAAEQDKLRALCIAAKQKTLSGVPAGPQ